jgi:hypothetical protein
MYQSWLHQFPGTTNFFDPADLSPFPPWVSSEEIHIVTANPVQYYHNPVQIPEHDCFQSPLLMWTAPGLDPIMLYFTLGPHDRPLSPTSVGKWSTL